MMILVRGSCFFVLLSLPALAGGSAGKTDYNKACKSCHGPNGEGNAKIAKMMKVALRPLGSKEVQAQSDAQLKKIILEGTGKMKATKRLSPAQADEVVAFLRTLAKR